MGKSDHHDIHHEIGGFLIWSPWERQATASICDFYNSAIRSFVIPVQSPLIWVRPRALNYALRVVSWEKTHSIHERLATSRVIVNKP